MRRPRIVKRIKERLEKQRKIYESFEFIDKRTKAMRDAKARETFIKVLESMRGKAANQYLLKILRNNQYKAEERTKIVSIYASKYPKRALPLYRILIGIRDIPASVRAQMALELGKRRSAHNARVLIGLLADPKEMPTVRIACIRALTNSPLEVYEKLLSRIARNPNENPLVRKEASKALASKNKMKREAMPSERK